MEILNLSVNSFVGVLPDADYGCFSTFSLKEHLNNRLENHLKIKFLDFSSHQSKLKINLSKPSSILRLTANDFAPK